MGGLRNLQASLWSGWADVPPPWCWTTPPISCGLCQFRQDIERRLFRTADVATWALDEIQGIWCHHGCSRAIKHPSQAASYAGRCARSAAEDDAAEQLSSIDSKLWTLLFWLATEAIKDYESVLTSWPDTLERLSGRFSEGTQLSGRMAGSVSARGQGVVPFAADGNADTSSPEKLVKWCMLAEDAVDLGNVAISLGVTALALRYLMGVC